MTLTHEQTNVTKTKHVVKNDISRVILTERKVDPKAFFSTFSQGRDKGGELGRYTFKGCKSV